MQALDYTHVDVGDGGEQERRHLAFRDYLRRHASVAAEYLKLKEELARIHGGATPEQRENYALGKSEFIERVIARAFADGLPELGRSDG